MGTHPIFESDFDCLTDMADNAIPLERTLALIKPDSVEDSSEIERIIKTSGFAILAKRRVNLSPEQVSDFYAEHYGKMFFTNLVSFMSAGPVVALVLAKENAIQDWRLNPKKNQKRLMDFLDGITFQRFEVEGWDLVQCLLISFCLGSKILKRIGPPQPPKKKQKKKQTSLIRTTMRP